METKYLREFVELANTLNFHQAARNLNTTQSNISKHLIKLEEEFGAPLFNRHGKFVELNDYGRIFLTYAAKIQELNQEAVSEVERLRYCKNNTLSIGFIPIMGQYGFIEVISEFCERYPDVRVNLIESTAPGDMLNQLQCDILLAPEDELSGGNLCRIQYQQDWLAALLPDDHPLANEKDIELSQLQCEAFIGHCSSSSTALDRPMKLKEICLGYGFTPKVIATISRTSTIVDFVRQGLGVALLFRKHLPSNIRGIKVVDIAPKIPVNICAFYLKDRPLSAASLIFLEHLKQHGKQTLTGSGD